MKSLFLGTTDFDKEMVHGESYNVAWSRQDNHEHCMEK
jgi:hypothetical protein